MKAKDYRLGNFAKDSLTGEFLMCCGMNCDIDGKNSNITFFLDNKDKLPLPDGWKAEPIKLTEEWAVKFGYECLVEMACDFAQESYFTIDIVSDDLSCMNVHEAQNLFFALTGTELILK
ncbi:MAG: hypothetical protein QNK20_16645 [Aureibaculum sp.]|nr:hypothetical protein [Aureibaculum sp.]